MFNYLNKIFKIRFFYKKINNCNIIIFDEVGSYYIKLLLKKTIKNPSKTESKL